MKHTYPIKDDFVDTRLDRWFKKEVFDIYGLKITNSIPRKKFDCILVAVSHNQFKLIDFSNLTRNKSIVYDLKGIISNFNTITL